MNSLQSRKKFNKMEKMFAGKISKTVNKDKLAKRVAAKAVRKANK
jgi:hypothetical protein